MKTIYIVLVVLCTSILFGCTQSTDTSESNNPVVNGPGEEVEQTDEMQPSENEEPIVPEPVANEFAGKSYGELLEMEKPIYCDVVLKQNSHIADADFYINGPNEIRVDIHEDLKSEIADCHTMTYILVDSASYIGCTDGCMYCEDGYYAGNEVTECLWDRREISSFDVSPESEFTCSNWEYDQSKFTIPSGERVCTQEEIQELIH